MNLQPLPMSDGKFVHPTVSRSSPVSSNDRCHARSTTQFADRAHIRLEGGLHDMLFYGVSGGGRF